MRQGIENPGLQLNWNAHFCQNPVVCEARICAKGFNAIFSNEVSSLATFVMNYLVKTKYFSHQYGVIFAGCFWLAYHHFLCIFLPWGLLSSYFFLRIRLLKGAVDLIFPYLWAKLSVKYIKMRETVKKSIWKLDLSEDHFFPIFSSFVRQTK